MYDPRSTVPAEFQYRTLKYMYLTAIWALTQGPSVDLIDASCNAFECMGMHTTVVRARGRRPIATAIPRYMYGAIYDTAIYDTAECMRTRRRARVHARVKVVALFCCWATDHVSMACWPVPLMPAKCAKVLASDARKNVPKCSQSATYKSTYI